MSLFYDLVALQAVDLEIDRLERQKVTLPELQELRRLHEQRKSVESDHGDASGDLRDLDLEFDRTNGELQIMEERLEIAEKKLFGGGMSSKETENRRLEVESLRLRIDQQESEALDLMEKRENTASRLKTLSTDLDEARSSESEVGVVVRGAWEEIDARLGKLRSERDGLAFAVPSAVMDTYESLRRNKGGVAAGRLEGSTCGGCHLALSESEREEAGKAIRPAVRTVVGSWCFRALAADLFFLYTDGAARGNPGPAAIGAVLYQGAPASRNVVAEVSRAIGRATNNVAEYQAVIEGLEVASDFAPRCLVVRCDSQLLVRQLLGEYRVKSAGLRPLHRRARQLLDGLPMVRLEHIRREHNRHADRLANRALDS